MAAMRDDLDALLAQAGWVRGLARELVGAGDADDLAQDAWVVALEQHARAANPAAWLSGVVRKLAGRRWRADERRGRRERSAARTEAQPGADELVAEAELQRALIRAVTELDEPYRSTVLLRFYRGLAPAEIARLQSVPAATVRTRLARGLERLRAKLDRDHGGRAAWVAVLAGPATLESAVITGGTLVGTKLAVTGAGALALLAGYSVMAGRDGLAGGGAGDAEVAAPVAEGPAGARQAPPDPERAAATAREAPEPATAAPATVAEVLLFGAVVDPGAKPVQLEWLSVSDALHEVRHASDAVAGSWSIAGLAPGRYRLEARARGYETLRETLELGAREHERHDLVLRPALSIPVRVVDETGAVVPETAFAPFGELLEVVVTRDPPGDGLAGLDRALIGRLLGLGELVEPDRALPEGCASLLVLRAPPPVHVALIALDATLDVVRVDGPMEVLELRVDRARLAERLGGVRARFVDALSGRPVEGGSATLDPPGRRTMGGPPIAGASVELTGRSPGLHRLRFFHAEYAELARPVRVPEGRVEDLGDVAVWPKAIVRGTVLDPAGTPVSATVRAFPLAMLRGPADLETDFSRATHGGRFEIEKAPRGLVRILVQATGHALLARTVDASSGLVDGVVLQLEEGVPVAFEPVEGAEGAQLTVADAHGVPLVRWTLGRTPFSTRLAPGVYQLLIGVAERVDSVEQFVVGHERLALPVGPRR
jgi:RNA polymerase sigma factor (sigma-70 family)